MLMVTALAHGRGCLLRRERRGVCPAVVSHFIFDPVNKTKAAVPGGEVLLFELEFQKLDS